MKRTEFWMDEHGTHWRELADPGHHAPSCNRSSGGRRCTCGIGTPAAPRSLHDRALRAAAEARGYIVLTPTELTAKVREAVVYGYERGDADAKYDRGYRPMTAASLFVTEDRDIATLRAATPEVDQHNQTVHERNARGALAADDFEGEG